MEKKYSSLSKMRNMLGEAIGGLGPEPWRKCDFRF